MPLALVQAVNWHTKRPEKYMREGGNVAWGDYYLLNTNRMSDIKTINTDNAQFLFSQAPDDRRASPDVIEISNPVSFLITTHDTAELSKIATIPIFPGWDATETAVDTLIEWDDICMIYQTTRDLEDDVSHMVYYRNGYKRVQCLIDLTVAEVLVLEFGA